MKRSAVRSVAPAFFSGLALALVLALLCACSPSEQPGRVEGPSDATTESGVPVLGRVPFFSLTEQSGLRFDGAELRGKVWVADFIFTQCTAICPLLSAQMAQLQRDLSGREGWEDVRLVSFSVDPENDTPQVLQTYATKMGADPLHWRFLTGERETIWRLTRDGFKLPVEAQPENVEMPILHSAKVVLVDRVGRIRGYYDGLDAADREKLRAELALVLAETRPLPVPEDVANPAWIGPRQAAQRAAAEGWSTFHEFRFTDRQPSSGITFLHRVTEDSGKAYKSNHYDHGNGVSAADVDGDGHLDLYFSNQVGSNALFRNRGDGTFEDITASAGGDSGADLGLADRIGVAAAFADVDNDGDADLFATSVRGGNVLFLNDGSGHFTDATAAAGVAGRQEHASGAVFFDYDRDGFLDLLVTNVGRYSTDEVGPGGYYVGYPVAFDGHLKPERAERSTLFRNRGDGTFEDVTEHVGLVETGWNGDAAPVDFNGDGFLDLFITDMQGHDEYYENQGGERFVARREAVFPATPYGTMGIQLLDFDNDGRMDLFLTDMHTDMVREFALEEEKTKLPADEMPPLEFLNSDGNHIRGNAFYHNLGDGRFEEISDRIGAENYWPWGLSTGDLNADGFEDAFLTTSMNYGWRYQANTLLLNEGGERFVDAEYVLGVEPRRGGFTAQPWFALDCSGADREHFLCQAPEGQEKPQGRFEVWGALGSRSSVLLDLEGDGDLDIVTNDFDSPPMVLVSDLTDRTAVQYLKVQLVGDPAKGSNRDAFGAKVTVRAGGRTFTQWHDGRSGYLSGSRMPLYFGLGAAGSIDAVEVTWPSGETTTVEGPMTVNRALVVTE